LIPMIPIAQNLAGVSADLDQVTNSDNLNSRYLMPLLV
jgi:hypothetical protein